MIKVHIITQDEPFFIPKMIKYLLSNQVKDFKIVSFTVLKPHRKNKSMLHWFSERAKIYNSFELLIASFSFLYVKLLNLIPFSGSAYSVNKVFATEKASEIKSSDINDDDYLQKIKSISPDVIISISCPQIFKEEILKIPSYFCINAHGTLLPRHRGVFGTWWTLFCKDKEAGGTIHTMELKLDAGRIIWQESFKVEENDTQFSLAFKSKKNMAYGLREILSKLNNGQIEEKESKFEESYHRAPSKEQGVKFHRMGNRVITVSDIPKMLSKDFSNA